MANQKKQIQAEEIARIENSIKVCNENKVRKQGEYDIALKKENDELELLNVKLEAMQKLKVT